MPPIDGRRLKIFRLLMLQLSSDMTEVEETVGRPRTELSEAEQKDLLQSWMNAQQAIVQFNHQAKIIQDDAKRVRHCGEVVLCHSSLQRPSGYSVSSSEHTKDMA